MSTTASHSENRRHSHTGLQTRIDDDGNTVEREFVVRGPSRYDIYNAERPFGESYRRSVQRSLSTDDVLPSAVANVKAELNAEALKENMGTYVSTLEERRKSKEKNVVDKDGEVILGEEKPQNYDKNGNECEDNKITINITNDLDKSASKTGPEIEDDNKNIITIVDTETLEKYNRPANDNKDNEHSNSDAREALMKEIREGKKLNNIEVKTEVSVKEEVNKTVTNGESCKPTDVASKTFVEEEYSYEPDKQETTSKIVVRQANVNDESHENFKNTLKAALSGGNPLKITTGPDGTFRFGSRRASSETNLVDDEDNEDIKLEENPARNSYVSNMKQAFDANEERARREADNTEVFDGLRHYLHENRYGLRELLVNNNVVIIEPIRNEYKKKTEDPADYNHKQLEGFEAPCRITGATVKSQSTSSMEKVASNTLPRAKSQHTNNRHGFYHPIKVNRELIDAELPDPDKVKSAREVFEKALFKSNGPQVISPPSPSTKMYYTSPRVRVTPEVRVIQECRQKYERRRHGRFIVDPVLRDDTKQRLQVNNKRWSDNGSLSSGVSSDLSLENDLSSNGSHRDTLDTLSSEEDDYLYGYDRDSRHPVSREVLEKIRACGTSVTYYGGKIISHSDGPIRSPMTMTIMDEIRQSQSRRNHSFSESQEPYLGVKFRLVKSNSCGSRLELAGADENDPKVRNIGHHESVIDKTISEEPAGNDEEVSTNKVVDTTKTREEENKTIHHQKDDDTSQSDVSSKPDVIKTEATVHTWSEVELQDARKQWHCPPDAVRREPDMEFENFEVLEDSSPIDGSPLKSEMNPPPGRGLFIRLVQCWLGILSSFFRVLFCCKKPKRHTPARKV